MRQTRVRLPNLQLDIFHPHPAEADWRTLPVAVRGRTVKLMAELFREHQQHLFSAAGKHKEVNDE